jgi:hypothetical protein
MLMALHEHAELHLLGNPMLAQSGKHATTPRFKTWVSIMVVRTLHPV